MTEAQGKTYEEATKLQNTGNAPEEGSSATLESEMGEAGTAETDVQGMLPGCFGVNVLVAFVIQL